MNQLPLIRDPSVVTSGVGEVFEWLYTPISQDAEWYFHRLRDTGLPLDAASIRQFRERLEYANRRTHDILGHVRNNSGDIYPLSDKEIAAISDEAWVFQVSTDKKVEKLLSYTSVGMKYFPRTFQYIENIDPYRFDKMSYQEKLTLLEIAGNERDDGIQKERPKLTKISYFYRNDILDLISRIKIATDALDIEVVEYAKISNSHETNCDYPSLGTHLPTNSINPNMAELGYLEYRKALTNQLYAHDSYKILEQFIFEESELVSLLNRWLGMSQMYQVADISEYFCRRLTPMANSLD